MFSSSTLLTAEAGHTYAHTRKPIYSWLVAIANQQLAIIILHRSSVRILCGCVMDNSSKLHVVMLQQLRITLFAWVWLIWKKNKCCSYRKCGWNNIQWSNGYMCMLPTAAACSSGALNHQPAWTASTSSHIYCLRLVVTAWGFSYSHLLYMGGITVLEIKVS